MINQDSLDTAVMNAATRINPDRPRHILRRWLNYFPPAAYPFIVAEYRQLTGQPSFEVREHGRWTVIAHELMRRLR